MKPNLANARILLVRSTSVRSGSKPQQGIVLITALILLVIMTLVALLSLQGSISGEKVSKNLRTSSVALQAAEIALRRCENDIFFNTPTFVINGVSLTSAGGATPSLWITSANWNNPAIANTVTVADVNSLNPAARAFPVLPRCIIEEQRLVTTDGTSRPTYWITARGFSPDFQVNASNEVISGSQVWLQSILRR